METAAYTPTELQLTVKLTGADILGSRFGAHAFNQVADPAMEEAALIRISLEKDVAAGKAGAAVALQNFERSVKEVSMLFAHAIVHGKGGISDSNAGNPNLCLKVLVEALEEDPGCV